jgi:hypothetical protein
MIKARTTLLFFGLAAASLAAAAVPSTMRASAALEEDACGDGGGNVCKVEQTFEPCPIEVQGTPECDEYEPILVDVKTYYYKG